MSTVSASATERWRTLPPTPALPAGTVGRYATIHGVKLWYAQWGELTQAVPVLLLHGGALNSNYFGELVPKLVTHGYCVIAMDSRGQGRSERGNRPMSYHLMASDVLGLMDQLHVRQVSLVGWSDGGIIGLDIAIRHPQRLARLFAFGANSDLSGLIPNAEQTPNVAAFLARSRDEYQELSPTRGDWASFDAAMNSMWHTQPDFSPDQLQSIHVPTTIADGEYDEIVKAEHTRYLAATIPNARLVILPGLSHFALLQDPDAFGGAVLSFLRN
jgi:pimeloyl-ACP methyl ester carboxylesterase